MDVKDFKKVAVEVAKDYFDTNTDLIESTVKMASDLNLTDDQLSRLCEHINGAVQIGLFSRGKRLEGFDMVMPNIIKSKVNSMGKKIFDIEDKIPETIKIPVTSSPRERAMNEAAERVRIDKANKIKRQKNKVLQERAYEALTQLRSRDMALTNEIGDRFNDIITDIIRSKSPESPVDKIRVVKITLGSKIASLITEQVEKTAKAKHEKVNLEKQANAESAGELNIEHPFNKKLELLKKAVLEQQQIESKINMYRFVTKMR